MCAAQRSSAFHAFLQLFLNQSVLTDEPFLEEALFWWFLQQSAQGIGNSRSYTGKSAVAFARQTASSPA
jgi:hypothetical protein